MKRMAIALLLVVACSPHQQEHPLPPPAQPATSASLASQDRDFLERAAQGNVAEVAIGGLVDGRAESGAVVEFGHMMVMDHGAAQKQLADVAQQLSIALPTAPGEHQIGYDKLVEKKDEPFDSEFVRVMIEDHQTAVQLYQGFLSNGVDPRLKAYAASTLPKIQMHLERAKALAVSR